MDAADIGMQSSAAAREAVSLVEDPHTRIIDCSTAHRTAPGWTYGFPELYPGQRAAIAAASRVANPGCHATGFLSIAAPVAMGLLDRDAALLLLTDRLFRRR